MENDSGTIFLALVIGIGLIALLTAKAVEFFSHFNADTRYLTGELLRAGDDDEYRYRRRQLRCHYLCLIPLVTEKNVMKVYRVFFGKSKKSKSDRRTDGIYHILAPSIVGIALCALCLCGTSWAWFTASTSAGAASIKTPTYTISYKIDGGEAAAMSESVVYTMTEGKCKVSLTAGGTEGATGYCSLQIGDSVYYTEQIFAVGDFTFTVTAPIGTEITITPKWGSCAVRTDENKIADGGNIEITNTANSESQPTGDGGTETPTETAPTAELTASEVGDDLPNTAE